MNTLLFGFLLAYFLACSLSITAQQVCAGSLGEPVVNINFDDGMALPFTETTYRRKDITGPNQSPIDGEYSIVNTTRNTPRNWGWLNFDGDRLGDGYFMLVNADYPPGIFYTKRVTNLCPNTSYTFFAWVLNVFGSGPFGIDPKITFIIQTPEGEVLDSASTPSIPEGGVKDWKPYSIFFRTRPNVSDVVLVMKNNAGGGIGNDFALDDITFQPCGPIIESGITAIGTTEATMCAGETQRFLLKANISGYDSPKYQWQVNKNNSEWKPITEAVTSEFLYSIANAGAGDKFQFRIQVASSGNFDNELCRISSDPVQVKVLGILPRLDVPLKICGGESFTLSASAGGKIYHWRGGGVDTITGASNSLLVSNPATGDYRFDLEILSEEGCLTKDSTFVSVLENTLAAAGEDVTICEGDSVILSGSGGTEVKWTPAIGLSDPNVSNPLAKPLVTTTYTLEAGNNGACTSTDQITVKVINKPVVDAGPDRVMVIGNPIQLNAKIEGFNYDFFWGPEEGLDDTKTLHPIISAERDITLFLKAKPKESDCPQVVDSVHVRVLPALIIPNAFTPNGDGINDNWHIIPLDTYPEAIITVYNRNGRIVFRSVGYTTSWNARVDNQDLPMGTYYYTIYLKKNTKPLSGNVLIAR